MSVRADVVDTGHKYRRAGTILVHAPIQKIFDIIADPYRHCEFDEPSRIAWRHLGHHRWRYELRSIDADTTEVTETFDGSTARFPPALALINAYDSNQKAIVKTLVRLKEIAESDE